MCRGAVEGVDDRSAVRGQRLHFEPTIVHKGRARIRDLAGCESRVKFKVTNAVLNKVTRTENRRVQRTRYRARARHIDVIHRDSEAGSRVDGNRSHVTQTIVRHVERSSSNLYLSREAVAETAQEKRFSACLKELT